MLSFPSVYVISLRPTLTSFATFQLKKSPSRLNKHLGATVLGDGDSEILYTHKILPGPCKMAADYGGEMAGNCGWPEDVVCEVNGHACRNIPGVG